MSLSKLICDLKDVYTVDTPDIEVVKRLMREYQASEDDEWKKFVIFDEKVAYTRILVDKGDGNFNLLALCWNCGRGSPIHDHSNSHCLMKILQGTLKETRYRWPEGRAGWTLGDPEDIGEEMRVLGTPMEYKTDELAYINDDLGLHRVENPSHIEGAVSLHLYTPPFDMCKVFDDNTSKVREAQMAFHKDFTKDSTCKGCN